MEINSTIKVQANQSFGTKQGSAAIQEPRSNILIPEKYLTKCEVATRLRKTTRTIDTWMSAGILPYMKIGRSVLFDWDDCQRHLDEYFRVSRFSGITRNPRIYATTKEGTDQ